MKKYGGMYVPDGDEFFGPILARDNGRFDDEALIKALDLMPKHPRVAVDVGAHVGTWSRVMAGVFEDVVAFEPVWDNFQCLEANTKDLSNVMAYCMAISSTNGALGFAQNKGHNSGTWRVTPGGDVSVVSLPLDHFQLENVDLIKIDVEGFELNVLHGAEETLKRCKPVLIIEENGLLMDYDFSERDIHDWLAFRGYCVFGSASRDVIYMPTPMGG